MAKATTTAARACLLAGLAFLVACGDHAVAEDVAVAPDDSQTPDATVAGADGVDTVVGAPDIVAPETIAQDVAPDAGNDAVSEVAAAEIVEADAVAPMDAPVALDEEVGTDAIESIDLTAETLADAAALDADAAGTDAADAIAEPDVSVSPVELVPCDAANPCAAGVCDPKLHACVGCQNAAGDCPPGQDCLQQKCVLAVGCISDAACKATQQVCDKTLGLCADCVVAKDCGVNQACINHTCLDAVPCDSSKTCAGVCDPIGGVCVQCAYNSDCPSTQYCNALHQCGPNICSMDGCGSGGWKFACQGGSFKAWASCDDGDTCTTDTCTKGDCGHVMNTAACDDGDLCTAGDVCVNDKCTSTPTNCDDNDACTTDSCDSKTGCGHVSMAATCVDGSLCTDDSCDVKTGKCVFAPNSAVCDDGSLCTTGDVCSGGSCVGAPANCDDGDGCTTDSCASSSGCAHASFGATCVDSNPCTDDACDSATGKCTFKPNSLACNDGSLCTSGDACSGGSCVGTAVNCSDNNPCTNDSCDAASGCHSAFNTAACSDGLACTIGDVCAGGSCQHGSPGPCDDGNVCTIDGCDLIKDCMHVNSTANCSDGNGCTAGDVCAKGSCAPGNPINCDDGNGCTIDSCDPTAGCSNLAGSGACNDANPCTSGEVCNNKVCGGGTPQACNDGNLCTDDTCAGDGVNCIYTAHDGLACDADGNACTVGDACAAKACKPGTATLCFDALACTSDACDPANGNCVFTAKNGAPCEDGNPCTYGDTCVGKLCGAGNLLVCDDGNPCTLDTCDSVKGCTTAPDNLAACDDCDACTVKDFCSNGGCVSGDKKDCDDHDSCTADACDSALGCVHIAAANGSACAFGLCTLNTCQAGLCIAGSQCDDKRACTTDYCNPSSGECGHSPIASCPGCPGFAGATCSACGDGYVYTDSLPMDQCAPDVPVWGMEAITPTDLVAPGDGTILDNAAVTPLMWVQADGAATTWSTADAGCKATKLLGLTGWRLPTDAELERLVDYGRTSPAIATVFAATTSSGPYWTSVTGIGTGSGSAWTIDFTTGADSLLFKNSQPARVRCVRPNN